MAGGFLQLGDLAEPEAGGATTDRGGWSSEEPLHPHITANFDDHLSRSSVTADSSDFTIAGTDPTRAPFCADWQPHGLLVEDRLPPTRLDFGRARRLVRAVILRL